MFSNVVLPANTEDIGLYLTTSINSIGLAHRKMWSQGILLDVSWHGWNMTIFFYHGRLLLANGCCDVGSFHQTVKEGREFFGVDLCAWRVERVGQKGSVSDMQPPEHLTNFVVPQNR